MFKKKAMHVSSCLGIKHLWKGVTNTLSTMGALRRDTGWDTEGDLLAVRCSVSSFATWVTSRMETKRCPACPAFPCAGWAQPSLRSRPGAARASVKGPKDPRCYGLSTRAHGDISVHKEWSRSPHPWARNRSPVKNLAKQLFWAS